jgi:hypothetical protein
MLHFLSLDICEDFGIYKFRKSDHSFNVECYIYEQNSVVLRHIDSCTAEYQPLSPKAVGILAVTGEVSVLHIDGSQTCFYLGHLSRFFKMRAREYPLSRYLI